MNVKILLFVFIRRIINKSFNLTSKEQFLFPSETLRKNLIYLEKDKVQVKNDYKKKILHF